MDKKRPVISLLSLAVSAILAGCGGGGDSTPTPPVTPTPEAKSLSVKAIDGYLKGAEVWLDINGNNALDSDEPYALSMEGGVAKLDVTQVANPAAYRVLVKAIAGKTVDETTGPVTKSFAMSAPAGVTEVTPLSTLVDQTIQQNPTLTQAQAVAQVAAGLKLPADKLLGDFLQESDVSLKKTLQVYAINVASEVLPSDLASADIKQVLDDSQAVGEALEIYLKANPLDETTAPDDIRVTKPDDQDVIVVIKDSDGDSVADADDAFPQDATESKDSDGDKVGDNSDRFPQDASESKDSDGDKVGDNSDAFPLDAKEWKDSDGDKVGDNSDAFPLDVKEWKDSDGDKVGDNSDAFPQDATETKDSDGDKVGDNSDAFPLNASESKDSDGDKVGDNSDAFPQDASESKDSDGDKVGDNGDAFPLNASESKDSDGDKVGDNSDAFPQDANRAQADVVSTEEKLYTYMEDHTKVSLDLKLVAKKTVSHYLDGRVVTQEEGTNYYWDKSNNDYLYLSGAKLIYNEYKNSNTENSDGTFLRSNWWHKDVNQDGQFQFAGQTVELGQKTATGETYWVFFDEDGALAETGKSINPNNHYDGGDLVAAVAAKDYSKVDMAHYVTLTKSGATEVRHFVQHSAPKSAPTDVVASDWLNIEAGTPVADYAETDTYTQLDDGGTLHLDEDDWAADGTINQMHSTESHPDGTLIIKSAGPIWANPQDGEFNEYADYNWQNSTERSSYWYEWSKSSRTVGGKTVTTSEGQRYVLDPTPNANVKLVTAEQPTGLKFNEYVSTETQVSATENTEFATWSNYHLEGYPFTAAKTDIGQNYKVFLKESSGFWVGHRFAEWGTQNVTDLAAKVEALRQQGISLDKIDASLLPGLSDYDGQLLNSSFRYQEDGQPRTWYWVTRLPAITGDNTWQSWKMVKLQLVDGGLTAAGYPNWIINDAGGSVIMLQPKSENPWAWYTAYNVWNLGVWKQEGHSIDTLNGRFGTGLGLFFLNEAEATTALNAHIPTLADSDKDGVVDADDAFPYDPSETVDSDQDGVGNNADAFPNDANETKDSDGDGVGDNAQALLKDGTVSAFLSNATEFFIMGDHGSDELWTDHWQSLGSGKFSWQESNILIGKSQYMVDPSSDDMSYRLTDAGWTAMTEYEDIQWVGNSDGSVSHTDIGHTGKLTGSCQDVGGKTLASAVSAITESTQVVDSSATFSPGALGCKVIYTAMATDFNYEVETWDYVGSNAVQVNGQQATALADLFSSSAPVASGPNAEATVFDKPIAAYSEQYGEVWLVLVRSAANATSGVAQLWQYNSTLHGYQLLSDITPANHQGWKLQTLHGVTLLTFSDAIQRYLEDEGHKAGFTEWQGRVQWVANSDDANAETILFMNKVAYEDLMKGRTLVTDSDDDDGDGETTPADAFADFITSGQPSYSLYQEGDALGITQLGGSSYQTYELDYAVAPFAIQPVADNGTITITRDGSNTVTFTTSNGSSSSVGTEVLDLNGTTISALLMRVTEPTNGAAVLAAVGNATFSSGAKAYITTHTDEGGQSIGIVLNDIAYQQFLAVLDAANNKRR